MEDRPGGPVVDPEEAPQVRCTHSVLRSRHQPGGPEPRQQGQAGPMEDRPRRDRRPALTVRTDGGCGVAHPALPAPTTRTLEAPPVVPPTELGEVLPALRVAPEGILKGRKITGVTDTGLRMPHDAPPPTLALSRTPNI